MRGVGFIFDNLKIEVLWPPNDYVLFFVYQKGRLCGPPIKFMELVPNLFYWGGWGEVEWGGVGECDRVWWSGIWWQRARCKTAK